jgi:hypothetical protein
MLASARVVLFGTARFAEARYLPPAMKTSVTCPQCGFIMFVNAARAVVEAKGWPLSPGAQGKLACPGCIADEQRPNPVVVKPDGIG